MSNFNTENFWADNSHLIVNYNVMQTLAMEMIGLNKKDEDINIGNKKTITYSEISTYSTCKRKWNLEYNEMWTRKVTKNYFYIGGLLHDCMEYLYTYIFYYYNGLIKEPVRVSMIIDFFIFLSSFRIEKTKVDYPERMVDIELLEFENNKGYAIITEYFKSVLPQDRFSIVKRPDSFKPFLETKFSNPVKTDSGRLSNKFLHNGKIDGLVLLNKDYYILENKFLSNFDSSDEEWLGKDLQILSYVYAIQEKYNIKITGVIYNVVKKPALRQKKGSKNVAPETETEFRARLIKDFSDRPEFYFKRYTVWVNQKDVAEIPFFIYDNCKEMGTSKNLPASVFICKRTGCMFKEVCLSDYPFEVLNNNFRQKEKKHEEL